MKIIAVDTLKEENLITVGEKLKRDFLKGSIKKKIEILSDPEKLRLLQRKFRGEGGESFFLPEKVQSFILKDVFSTLDPHFLKHIANPAPKFIERIILESPLHVANHISHKAPKELQFKWIEKDPSLISSLINADKELFLFVLEKNPSSYSNMVNEIEYRRKVENTDDIKDKKELIEELTKKAVFLGNSDAFKIAYKDNKNIVNEIPEESKILLLKKLGGLLEYFKKPSEKMQLAAVTNDPFVIDSIKNPSEKVQMAAFKKDEDVIEIILERIKNPSLAVIFEAIKRPRLTWVVDNEEIRKKISQEMLKEALKSNPRLINYIEKVTEKDQLIAVKKDPSIIAKIKNPSKKVLLAALETHPPAIRYVKDIISEEIKERILLKDYGVLEYNINISDELAWKILRKFPDAISYFYENIPTKEMIKYALPKVKDPKSVLDLIHYHNEESGGIKIPYPKEFVKKIADLVERFQKKAIRFRPELLKKQYIPKDLNADQLALLRWFDLNERNSISVRELKQLPFGNSPYFQDLIKQKQGKDITKEDILKPSFTESKGLIDFFKKEGRLGYTQWKGDQIIFKKPNHVMVWYLSKDKIPHDYKIPDPDPNGSHPKIGRNITIGWVRYTLFDKDIWIDEIQSDLGKKLSKELMEQIKNLPEVLMGKFIREMRKRGYQKFYLPSYDVKKNIYNAEPPVSLYRDLPKKFRFKPTVIDRKDILKDMKRRRKNQFEGWILAKNN